MNKLRILLTICLLAEQFSAPAAFVFAQYEQDEEAPGRYVAQAASSPDDGGPILEQPPAEPEPEPEPEAEAPLPRSIPQAPTPGRRITPGKGKEGVPMYQDAEATRSPMDRLIGPINLNKASISAFLHVITVQSGINFILAENIEKTTLSVFLGKKISVRDALELLNTKGLTYQRVGKSYTYVIRRRTAESVNLLTKVYVLNYIPLIKIATVGENMNAITAPDVSSSGMRDETEQRSSRDGSKKNDPTGIALLDIVQSILSANGKMATDPRTNSLVITDIPEVFPQIEQIISELDKKAPQIHIEAQIVEINTDRLNELGIEWGGSRGEMAYFAGPARLTDYGLRPGFFSGDSWKYFYPGGDVSVSADSSSSGSGSGGGVDAIFSTGKSGAKGIYYGVFSLAQLQAIFRALVSRGEARYLGKPKIMAMNNTTSIITISRDSAVGTASTVSSAGGASGQSSTSVERRRVGLTLRVTPQVNKEGYVTLVIQPSYSDTVPSGIAVQGQTILDPVTRGASTMVRVKDGQTVVIGGMLSSTENKSVKKVPLLGYIPIIGWLFTSVSTRRTNTDMAIFVTPTIMVD